MKERGITIILRGDYSPKGDGVKVRVIPEGVDNEYLYTAAVALIHDISIEENRSIPAVTATLCKKLYNREVISVEEEC